MHFAACGGQGNQPACRVFFFFFLKRRSWLIASVSLFIRLHALECWEIVQQVVESVVKVLERGGCAGQRPEGLLWSLGKRQRQGKEAGEGKGQTGEAAETCLLICHL